MRQPGNKGCGCERSPPVVNYLNGEHGLSQFLERIQELIGFGEVRISEHGYDELAEDDLTVKELLAGVLNAVVIEEYPNYPKGACILLLQKDRSGKPVHVVWGIPKGYNKPVVLVTAYRPDPAQWDENYLKRR